MATRSFTDTCIIEPKDVKKIQEIIKKQKPIDLKDTENLTIVKDLKGIKELIGIKK